MPTEEKPTKREQELLRQVEQLRLQSEEQRVRLTEAEETLRAIREGEVDAVVVVGSKGEQIFSLVGTDSVYRLIVETMKEAAFTVALDGKVLFCNAQFGQFVKRPLEQIVGHPLPEFIAKNSHAAATSLLIAAQENPVKQRLVFQGIDGAPVPAHVSANVLNQPDGLSICVVASDLTDLENSTELIQQQRRQQESLRKSEERLALAASATHIGMFDWNVPARTVLWTQAHEAIFGYAPAAATATTTTATATATTEHDYRAWADRVHPEDMPRVEEELRRCQRDRTPLEVQYRIIWPDGSLHWVDSKGIFLYGSDGNAERMLGVVMDITAHKQAEAELARTKTLLETLLTQAPVGFTFIDRELSYVLINEQLAVLNGLPVAAHVGKHVGDIVPTMLPAVQEVTSRIVATGQPVKDQEFTGETAAQPGVTRYWNESWFPIREGTGAIVGFGAVVEEITERKRAEEELRALLHEKEVLLKEVHHRVKNNMQVLASLVSLQADNVDDPATRDVLDDLRDQVRTMALVHENLYQSESLADIDFAQFTRGLTASLARSHGRGNSDLRLTLDVELVTLPVESAVPCGLILNELVTNAYKHAFRGRKSGEVVVGVHAVSAGRVCLSVRDDGVGLPAGVDWRQSPSLGLRLVQMLARQVHGELDMRAENGTTFQLTFAPSAPKGRDHA